MEPICEAKFYKHSYGFRPNRSTHHAIARVLALTNLHDFQYVVDIDIKGFFENINHGKLLKQIWSMGIRDKNLICIISKMLKAEIKGIGIPEKGVPQGGILSPLLSNIVLNEFDWWISSQWETYESKHKYSTNEKKYRALRGTNLKEVFIVRYADDFKLFCKKRKTAEKLFTASKKWLKERLGLEVSPEKSKIVNLRKRHSEFLGIKFKLRKKDDKEVIKSNMTEKAKKKCIEKLKEHIKSMQKTKDPAAVNRYNAAVLGMHSYYSVASHISEDFGNIAFIVNKSLKCRKKRVESKTGYKSMAYKKFYGDFKGKEIYINKIILFPISHIRTKPPMCYSQEICNYTEKGRQKIHDKLGQTDLNILKYIMKNPIENQSEEYNDNRISLYVGQKGKCFITKNKLEIPDMEVHHKIPRNKGGTDEYRNLMFVEKDIHRLIHATQEETIEKYMQKYKNAIDVKRLNKLRVLAGNCEIPVHK